MDLRGFEGFVGCLERHSDELGNLLLNPLLRLLLLKVEHTAGVDIARIWQTYACFGVLIEEGFGVD